MHGCGVSGGDGGTAHPVSIVAALSPHEICLDRQPWTRHCNPEGRRKRPIALYLEFDAAVADIDDSRLRALDFRGDLADDRLPIPPAHGPTRLALPCADNRLFDQGKQ